MHRHAALTLHRQDKQQLLQVGAVIFIEAVGDRPCRAPPDCARTPCSSRSSACTRRWSIFGRKRRLHPRRRRCRPGRRRSPGRYLRSPAVILQARMGVRPQLSTPDPYRQTPPGPPATAVNSISTSGASTSCGSKTPTRPTAHSCGPTHGPYGRRRPGSRATPWGRSVARMCGTCPAASRFSATLHLRSGRGQLSPCVPATVWDA